MSAVKIGDVIVDKANGARATVAEVALPGWGEGTVRAHLVRSGIEGIWLASEYDIEHPKRDRKTLREPVNAPRNAHVTSGVGRAVTVRPDSGHGYVTLTIAPGRSDYDGRDRLVSLTADQARQIGAALIQNADAEEGK